MSDGSDSGDRPVPESPEPAGSRRAHDSSATRQDLIEAGRDLFHERGYAGATVRAIGERAGADPALIARYFGNKEGLYLATLTDESDPTANRFSGMDPVEIVSRIFDIWEEPGRTPVARAMAAPEIEGEVLDQLRTMIRNRVRRPLVEGFADRGSPGAAVESELLIAMVLGVCIARGNGTLPALGAADHEEVAALLRQVAAEIV